jgi:hypothetical protein
MRPLLKYGVPAAAGLATGGYALSQGEDPGSAVLAGLGGAAGGAAGLLGARGLAGKYNPALVAAAQKQVANLGNKVGDVARNLPEKGLRRGAANVAADAVSALDTRLFGDPNAVISAHYLSRHRMFKGTLDVAYLLAPYLFLLVWLAWAVLLLVLSQARWEYLDLVNKI